MIAVLSLTRDRLAYTEYCFATLRENAGCEFDHFVLDQCSTDGTADWLREHEDDFTGVIWSCENVGISKGMNMLLDEAGPGYDAVCTFDNDCEVVMDGTLDVCARLASDAGWIISPTVCGLNQPPRPSTEVVVEGERIGFFPAIGGIFRVMPGAFADGFRFSEANPFWGGDENDVGEAARGRGYPIGYLLDWFVNHYETTEKQKQTFPAYWQRKQQEMGIG